jgi:hypothetical protein
MSIDRYQAYQPVDTQEGDRHVHRGTQGGVQAAIPVLPTMVLDELLPVLHPLLGPR